jgi:hypothetical protein
MNHPTAQSDNPPPGRRGGSRAMRLLAADGHAPDWNRPSCERCARVSGAETTTGANSADAALVEHTRVK